MDSIVTVILENENPDSFFIAYQDGHSQIEKSRSKRLIYNRMIFIQQGAGTLLIDDVNFVLGENQLFLISKGQVLSFGEGSVYTGYNLVFGDCFWEKTPSSASNCKAVLFNNASDNQLLQLSSHDSVELDFLFKSLFQEFLKPGYVNKLDALAAYLKIIMIKVANVNAALTKGFDSHEKQLYRQFLELISIHYQNSHEVSDYAKQLGISTRKLTELSKRCSGKGAKDLINGQLISEAKRFLQFSSRPVKEIAYELNFSRPDQFSHFFKKNVMISPHDYRAKFMTNVS